MKKFLSLSILTLLSSLICASVEVPEMSIENRTKLNAYVTIQSVLDESVQNNFYIVYNQILPNQTRAIPYNSDGLPKRIGISLGFKPSSFEDLHTFVVDAPSSQAGMQFVIAPVENISKTVTLVKTAPYINGIVGSDFILYPISSVPYNVTALNINIEKQADISAPPSYRPQPPVPSPISESKTEEVLGATTDLSNQQKRAYIESLLKEIKFLSPSNKELWDAMSREELSQEYFRLSNELEDNEYNQDGQTANTQFKQLFADIEYVRNLLQNVREGK